MEQITVRAYCPGDEVGILALYRDVFEVNITLEQWKWTYLDNPSGMAIVAIAQQGDRIVGHYGIQPRSFLLAGQPCIAGLTVGTMVHPCARNLTTFVEMAQLAYDLSRQRGMAFLYSFSRDDAWKVRQVVLGWQALPQLTAWEGPLQPSAGPSEGDPFHPIKTYDLSTFPLTQVGIPSHLENSQGIRSLQTLDGLMWRFGKHPTAQYKLLVVDSQSNTQGYAVLKEYVRDGVRYGHIVDWGVPPDDDAVARSLFNAAQQEFLKTKVQQLSCWASPQSSLLPLLQSHGFTHCGPSTNFGYFKLQPNQETMLANHLSWTIYMGDSDVY